MSKASVSATIALTVGSMFIAGCATKGYVATAVQPIDQKVDQVDKNSQQAGCSTDCGSRARRIKYVDEDEKSSPPPDEIAKTADNEAKGAMSKANQNAKETGRPAKRRREHRRLQARYPDSRRALWQ
jgi:outer membrane murein-binding lipoprotein Lpp